VSPLRVGEPLEDHGDLEQAARPHLVRVLLEAALPVRQLLDLAVAEEIEDLADVGGADHGAKAHTVGVLLGNPHAGIVGEDTELVEADLATVDGPRLDALHDANSVIGVDNLLANLEFHGGPLFQFTAIVRVSPAGKGIERDTSFYQSISRWAITRLSLDVSSSMHAAHA